MTKRITVQELNKKVDNVIKNLHTRVEGLAGKVKLLENDLLKDSLFQIGDKVFEYYPHEIASWFLSTLGKTHYIISKKELGFSNGMELGVTGSIRTHGGQLKEGIIYTVVNLQTGIVCRRHEDDLHIKGWF